METKLTDNDRQRIEQKAREIWLNWDNDKLSHHEKAIMLAEYATLYEREQQAISIKCPTCDGYGEVEQDGLKACPSCGGNEFVEIDDPKAYIKRLEAERAEIESLKFWKKQQIEIWLPLIEYMQEHGKELGMRYGEHISEKALQIIKERAEFRDEHTKLINMISDAIEVLRINKCSNMANDLEERLDSLKTKP